MSATWSQILEDVKSYVTESSFSLEKSRVEAIALSKDTILFLMKKVEDSKMPQHKAAQSMWKSSVNAVCLLSFTRQNVGENSSIKETRKLKVNDKILSVGDVISLVKNNVSGVNTYLSKNAPEKAPISIDDVNIAASRLLYILHANHNQLFGKMVPDQVRTSLSELLHKPANGMGTTWYACSKIYCQTIGEIFAVLDDASEVDNVGFKAFIGGKIIKSLLIGREESPKNALVFFEEEDQIKPVLSFINDACFHKDLEAATVVINKQNMSYVFSMQENMEKLKSEFEYLKDIDAQRKPRRVVRQSNKIETSRSSAKM